jgi:hypothetical protein
MRRPATLVGAFFSCGHRNGLAYPHNLWEKRSRQRRCSLKIADRRGLPAAIMPLKPRSRPIKVELVPVHCGNCPSLLYKRITINK